MNVGATARVPQQLAPPVKNDGQQSSSPGVRVKLAVTLHSAGLALRRLALAHVAFPKDRHAFFYTTANVAAMPGARTMETGRMASTRKHAASVAPETSTVWPPERSMASTAARGGTPAVMLRL